MSRQVSRHISDIPLISTPGLLGHTRLLRRDPVEFMHRLSRGGDLFRVQLLDKKVLVLTGAAVVQEALVDHADSLDKDALMRYLLYPFIGEGLFNSNGQLWRRQRRLMAPIFQPAQLGRYAPLMVEQVQRTIHCWQDGEPLNLWSETTRIAMSIAGVTLFGAETFSETDELGAALTVAMNWSGRRMTSVFPLLQIAFRKALERAAEHLPERAAVPVQRFAQRLNGPLLTLGAFDRQMRGAVALLDERVERMINERRTSRVDCPDLLSRLLAAQEQDLGAMTNRQVRDEILTLFVAGHETTASALAWAVYLLVRHPDLYARARLEVDALGRPPTAADLPRLQWTLRVFKEALRLYPPVPLFSREVRAPIVLGGYLVPAGTVLVICPFATHRRPEYWPDPEHFDPDRFLPAVEAARPRYAYLAFSGGPRVCIGIHFALAEGPLVLATLLQGADFALCDGAAIVPEVQATLRPRGGLPMRVRLRRGSSAAP